MKQLLIIFFIALSVSSFAQKSDTLIVPVGKYQFIKVGDKVYKLVTTLEEALPAPKTNGILYWNNGIQSDSLAYPSLQAPFIMPKNGSELYYLNSLNSSLDRMNSYLLNFKQQ